MIDIALLVGVVVLVALYVTWTAGRLDRMHARVDAAWNGLDAQLVRRAAAAQALLAHLPPGPQAQALAAQVEVALDSGTTLDTGVDTADREAVENALTRSIRAAVAVLPDTPEAARALAEVEAASTRVGLARSFHNGAVTDTRALRLRRMPRLLRLAGHRGMPAFFDVDDTSFGPLGGA